MERAGHSAPPAPGWAWCFGAVGVAAVATLNLLVVPRLGAGPSRPDGVATAGGAVAPAVSPPSVQHIATQHGRVTMIGAPQVQLIDALQKAPPRPAPAATAVPTAPTAPTATTAPTAPTATAAQTATAAPAEPARAEVAVSERPRAVLAFPVDAVALDAAHEAALAPLVARLRARPDCALDVDCHADRFGDARFNYSLTQRRCRSVAAYVAASGAGTGRVHTRAHGERDTPGRDGVLDAGARVARVVLVCGAAPPAGAHVEPEEETHGDHPVR